MCYFNIEQIIHTDCILKLNIETHANSKPAERPGRKAKGLSCTFLEGINTTAGYREKSSKYYCEFCIRLAECFFYYSKGFDKKRISTLVKYSSSIYVDNKKFYVF